MDPLSITAGAVGLAKVSWHVGQALHDFIHQTQNVDQTVRDLQSGIKQVENLCLMIKKHLELLPQNDDTNEFDNEDLYVGIHAQIASCAAAIHLINSKIELVRQNKTNVIQQAYRQVRLNMNQDDISNCKEQIRAGVMNLQISLQLVNLQATYLAPRLANQSLLDKLDEIQQSLNSDGVDKRLQDCADNYITRGTSLYTRSVTSAAGGLRDAAKPKAIASWLEQVNALTLDDTTSTISSADRHSTSFPSLSATSGATSFESIVPDKTSSRSRPSVIGDDDEDEFSLEMFETSLKTAKEFFDSHAYLAAETELKESLDLLALLTERRRREQDLESIHLMLALCAYEIHDSSVAETALLSVLEKSTESDTHTAMRFTAAIALAVVYVRLGKYDQARFSCENVYRGRRKVFGKDHGSCYDALALLSKIHELQDMPARANTYKNLIPSNEREARLEIYSHLNRVDSEKAAPNTLRDKPSAVPTTSRKRVETAPPIKQLPVEKLFSEVPPMEKLSTKVPITEEPAPTNWPIKSPRMIKSSNERPSVRKPVFESTLAESGDMSLSWDGKHLPNTTYVDFGGLFGSLTFSRDDTMMAYASTLSEYQKDSSITIHNFSTDSARKLKVKESCCATALEFGSQSQNLVSAHGGFHYSRRLLKDVAHAIIFLIWNINSGEMVRSITTEYEQVDLWINSMTFSSLDDSLIVCCRTDPDVSKDMMPRKAPTNWMQPGCSFLDMNTGLSRHRIDCGPCKVMASIAGPDRVALQIQSNRCEIFELNSYSSSPRDSIVDVVFAACFDKKGILHYVDQYGRILTYRHGMITGHHLWPKSERKIKDAALAITPTGDLIAAVQFDFQHVELVCPSVSQNYIPAVVVPEGQIIRLLGLSPGAGLLAYGGKLRSDTEAIQVLNVWQLIRNWPPTMASNVGHNKPGP